MNYSIIARVSLSHVQSIARVSYLEIVRLRNHRHGSHLHQPLGAAFYSGPGAVKCGWQLVRLRFSDKCHLQKFCSIVGWYHESGRKLAPLFSCHDNVEGAPHLYSACLDSLIWFEILTNYTEAGKD